MEPESLPPPLYGFRPPYAGVNDGPPPCPPYEAQGGACQDGDAGPVDPEAKQFPDVRTAAPPSSFQRISSRLSQVWRLVAEQDDDRGCNTRPAVTRLRATAEDTTTSRAEAPKTFKRSSALAGGHRVAIVGQLWDSS